MYDELITRLRDAAKVSAALTVFLPQSNGNAMVKLLDDAADAIAELKKKVDEWQETACNWNNEYYHLLDNKPRWISVEDRLPDEGEYVLATRLSLSGKMMAVSFWFRDDRNKAHWGGENELLVTHWMPLPQPPKEET